MKNKLNQKNIPFQTIDWSRIPQTEYRRQIVIDNNGNPFAVDPD